MKLKSHHLPRLLAAVWLLNATTAFVHADYASTVQSLSPLAYWRFDESIATPPLNTMTNLGTLGSPANGYAMNGATKGQPGIVGNSIRFSNPGNIVGLSSNKVEIPYNAALNSAPPFSIEFWAKPNSLGTDDAGFCPVSNLDPNWYSGNRSGWLFYVNSNGVWNFRLGKTDGYAGIVNCTNGNAQVGSWQHIVATFDGTNAAIYANGLIIGGTTNPVTSYVRNSQSFLRIGGIPLAHGNGEIATAISASSNIGNRGYDGWVDELAVYTNLLSPATIAAHYAAGINNPGGYQAQIMAGNPVGYWNLNEPAVAAPDPASLPVSVNIGSLGSTADATNQWGTLAAQPGAGYAGFGAGNKAAFFDGHNGYVQVKDAPGLHFSGNITLMAWVKPTEQDFFRDIIAHGFNTNFTETFLRISRGPGSNGYGDGNYYEVGSGGGVPYVSTYYPIPPGDIGNWVFIAGVYDGSYWKLYRNGMLVSSAFANNGAYDVTNRWTIGSRADPQPGQGQYFGGWIDEPAIFNYALSDSDIANLYSAAQVPPIITAQPQPTTSYAGLRTTLQVTATGSEPLSFQWLKNTGEIGGANDRVFTIPSLDYTDAGNYSVRVSNGAGQTNSLSVYLAVLPPPTTAPAIPGLVLHLPFNGNLTDVTGRGNNGVSIHKTTSSSNAAPATYVSDAPLGQGLHFATDAINTGGQTSIATDATYVTLGVRPDLQFGSGTDFSVAYWIRIPYNFSGGDLPFFTDAAGSVGNNGFVFATAYGYGTADSNPINTPDNYGGWAMSVYGSGVGASYYGDIGSLNDGNWHHLVHTVNRTTGEMVTYLDGSVANAVKTAGTSVHDSGNITTGQPATIGQDPTGSYGETGSGDIDDLGVWQKVLTPLEAASIYSAAVNNQLSYVDLPVTVTLQMLGANQLNLSWPAGTLQSADNVQGPYTDVANAASPYPVTPNESRKFYRIRL